MASSRNVVRHRFAALLLFLASVEGRTTHHRRDEEQFSPPSVGGGSMLTSVVGAGGRGEPINVIISATSDSDVLVNSAANGGLLNYFQSIGFSGECLGQHIGNHQGADLGDGNGEVNETAVMRWNYGDPNFGTCKESVDGGNHFRYWIQNGPQASTGAIFLAVSVEMSSDLNHLVVFQGYNLGRDQLLGNATAQSSAPPTLNYALPPLTSESTSTSINSTTNATLTLTTTSTSSLSLPTIAASVSDPEIKVATYLPTFKGVTSAKNYSYSTTSTYLSGLLANSSDNINHFDSVGDPATGVTAVDGLVALLEVKIVARPGDSSNSAWQTRPLSRWTTYTLPVLLIIGARLIT